VRRLFAVFDRDNNGVVDFAELVAGLSVLCGGSRDDKIVHAFRVIDVDGDGRISIDEMIAYLTGVFKLVFRRHPKNWQRPLRCSALRRRTRIVTGFCRLRSTATGTVLGLMLTCSVGQVGCV
jgi:hypothetical protein